MEQQLLGTILAKRRDRSIAIVLGVKERECDKDLTPEARTKLRKVVLDQFNEYHDFCADVLRSLEGHSDSVLNEVWLDKIDTMHSMITEIASRE